MKDCADDEEFINKANAYLSSLKSSHTRVLNRDWSYEMMYDFFPNLTKEGEKNPYAYVQAIAEKPEVKSVYQDYLQKKSKNSSPSSPTASPEKTFSNLHMEDVIPQKVAYIHIQSFGSNHMEQDREPIYSYLQKVKDYPVLILDVRDNGGGDTDYLNLFLPELMSQPLHMEIYTLFRDRFSANEYVDPLISIQDHSTIKKKIEAILEEQYPHSKDYMLGKYHVCNVMDKELEAYPNSIHYKGHIYILNNEATASAAGYTGMFIKMGNLGTIVGRNTAAECGGMNPAFLVLPNTKLLFRMTSSLSICPKVSYAKDGYMTNNVLYPDVYVRDASRYLKEDGRVDMERDQCIQQVLELENMK